MIQGVGIDIIELSRVKMILERQPKFIDRVLTEREKDELNHLSGLRQVEFLAGRFAAKEAYSKAMGTGIGGELSFLDIEIQKDGLGKPFVFTSKSELHKVHLSISHSRDYAVAQVIIEK